MNMCDGKIKMQVIAAEGKIQVVEYSVNFLLNNLNMAAGIIMITNRKLINHE